MGFVLGSEELGGYRIICEKMGLDTERMSRNFDVNKSVADETGGEATSLESGILIRK